MKHPIILAIDTSCDDTSVALTRGWEVLANVVASQTQLHKPYGGVFPTVAKQAHKENLPLTVDLALKRAHVHWDDVAALAVTQGPGLAPALEVGISYAKELAMTHHKPLLPVNHIEGHVLSALAVPKGHQPDYDTHPPTNALAIVVSGGHTEFVKVREIGQYQRLGWTIDDAAGEVLDKVGRMLDLGYPAGPVLEQFALYGNDHVYAFPVPMTTSRDYNLSFSGLKTHARNLLERLQVEKPLNQTQTYDFAASFQKAVFKAICYKLNKILQKEEIFELWLGGGVAANNTLRRMIRSTGKKYSLHLRVPYTKKLCSDNAAMIGIVAGQKLNIHPTDIQFERQPRLQLNT